MPQATTTTNKRWPKGYIPLENLAAHVADPKVNLDRAQALYDNEPTRAHLENLKEAQYEYRLWQRGQQQ